MGWLSTITSIPNLVKNLQHLIDKSSGRATKNLLVRELKINLKAFEVGRGKAFTDYDKLLDLLETKQVSKAISTGYNFKKLKNGIVELSHVNDKRNQRFVGKDCEWLFNNYEEKISILRKAKQYHGSLNNIENLNVPSRFSNLFFLLKLLTEFVSKE